MTRKPVEADISRPRRRASRSSASQRRPDGRREGAEAEGRAGARLRRRRQPRRARRAQDAPSRRSRPSGSPQKYPVVLTVDRATSGSRLYKKLKKVVDLPDRRRRRPASRRRPAATTIQNKAVNPAWYGARTRRGPARWPGTVIPGGIPTTRSRRAGWASTTASASTAPTRSRLDRHQRLARLHPDARRGRRSSSTTRSPSARRSSSTRGAGCPAGARRDSPAPISSSRDSSQPGSSSRAWWSRVANDERADEDARARACAGPRTTSSSRRPCPGSAATAAAARRCGVADARRRRAGAAWRPCRWTVSMKKTPIELEPCRASRRRRSSLSRCSRPRRATRLARALVRFDEDLRRRGAAEKTRQRLRHRPAPVRRLGERASDVEPAAVTHRVAAPLRRRAVRAPARARRPSRASSPRCARSSACCASTARSRPTRPTCSPRPSAPPSCRACSRPSEISRLLDRIPASTPLELRDRALFEIAYASGLRAEELVDARPRLGRLRRRGAARRGQGRQDADRARRRARAAGAARATSSAPARRSRTAPGRARAVPLEVRPPAVDVRRPAAPARLVAARRDAGRACTRTRCVTPSRPTCWTAARTCARSRSCSVMRRSRRRRSTLG